MKSGVVSGTLVASALCLALGTGCSVYPDQEVHSNSGDSTAELAAGGDTYTVVLGHDFAQDEKSAENFPGNLSFYSARLANPQITSLTTLKEIALSCKPELLSAEWEKLSRAELIRWSDGALQFWLMFNDGTEKNWDVSKSCLVKSERAQSSTSARP